MQSSNRPKKVITRVFPHAKPAEKQAIAFENGEDLQDNLRDFGFVLSTDRASELHAIIGKKPPLGLLLEGSTGSGKTFLTKCLAKALEYKLKVVTCHPATGPAEIEAATGTFLSALEIAEVHPTLLLIDNLDATDNSIDYLMLKYLIEIFEEQHTLKNLIVIATSQRRRAIAPELRRLFTCFALEQIDVNVERAILEASMPEGLAAKLVELATLLRMEDTSYSLAYPPSAEDLRNLGEHLSTLLSCDEETIGRAAFSALAKDTKDRATLELFLRFHPKLFDPSCPDGRKATVKNLLVRLGRFLKVAIGAEHHVLNYAPQKVGLINLGEPDEIAKNLKGAGYECLPFVATQIALLMNTPSDKIRSLMLEGPSGCGKSYFAKSLAKITGAELMCLSCYEGMNVQHLLESPSELAIAKASVSQTTTTQDLVNLGIISRAFLKSQSQPVILLIDEIDKTEGGIDTFFLGPIQDGRIWLESRPPIDANLDNLLIIFTKNYARVLNDALLRRVHPIRMTYLSATLERNVLSKHCFPQLVANLVSVAERMRESNGSYQFERPPAPEELLTAGHYVLKLLEWNMADFGWVGKNVWAILSKSEHDRAVLEHMMRFHPDFLDPLTPDGRNASQEKIMARLGRVVLKDIVVDPEAEAREKAWKDMEYQ